MPRLPATASLLAALALLACLSPARAGTPNNVDTGIKRTQCYAGGSDVLVSCGRTDLAGQDGQGGRDADPATNRSTDGVLGLSFSKVCNSGQAAGTGTCPADPALGSGTNDWACVTDLVTGIMWEVKTTSGTRAHDLTYTNYSRLDNPVGEYGSPTDATGYIAAVNRSALCGYTDWALAHTDKIVTILDFGTASPGRSRVDGTYFPNVDADWYWNNSPNPTSTTTAFAVDFLTGEVDNTADRSTRRRVTALRNGQTVSASRYQFSPDGSQVADTMVTVALDWRRCVEGMAWNGSTCTGTPLRFTHEQALRRAAEQSALTGLPWRVPSVKELNGIVERVKAVPALDHSTFPQTPAEPTWTSSPESRLPAQAWAVDFGVGLVLPQPRTSLLVLRLARDPAPF